MAKSVGNVTLVHDLIERYDGEVLRLTLLSAHYRQPLDWSVNAIEQIKSVLDRLYTVLYNAGVSRDTLPAAELPKEMIEALCDDVNTPKAMAVLSDIAKQASQSGTKVDLATLLAAGDMLGVLRKDPAAWLGYENAQGEDAGAIEGLLVERTEAKAAKNFARADEIRDELLSMGYAIEDTPEGPKLRKAS